MEKCVENSNEGMKVKMMCWNVAGWANGDVDGGVRSVEERDMRANVINFYNPDVVCLVETWLKGGDVVGFEGYHWFGSNRGNLSRRAVRGSGGVGVMVKNSFCENWLIEIVDVTLEDVIWVKFQHEESDCVVFVAVCYIPPVGSSRDVDVAERLLLLEEQTQRFQAEGQVILCGDFNARCGGLTDVYDETMERCCVDMVRNEQGEMLVECMKNTGLCFVNGRQGADEFTCISSKGRSVVDYCLVSLEELASVENFVIETMSQCEAHLCVGEEGIRVPDHSVLMWD